MAQHASIRTSSSREYTSFDKTGRAGAICILFSQELGGVVTMLEKTYRIPIRLGHLAAAKIAECPSSIPQHAELATISQQVKQRLQGTAAQDKVSALGAITGNIAQSPHSLFPNIGFRTSQQFDKDWHSSSLNNHLGLRGGTGSNIGQSPSSLELNQSVSGSQKFDEATNNAGLDNFFYWGVALLRQELTEFRCGLDLQVDLV